jgi:hypothetical protein
MLLFTVPCLAQMGTGVEEEADPVLTGAGKGLADTASRAS